MNTNNYSDIDLSIMLESIDIELSGACNARCVFCPRDKMTREKQNMHPSVMERLISEIASIRPDGPKTIYFSGFGEPLLNKDIFIFARMIMTAFPQTDLVLISNGGLLDQNICDQLLESPVRTFFCSFQSADPELHESRMPGLKHENVANWLAYLALNRSNSGINVAATCVVNEQTEDEITKLKDYFKWLNVPLHLARIHNRGGFFSGAGSSTGVRKHCMLFNTRVFIAANGDLLACCSDIDASTKLGNIASQSLKEILLKKINRIESGHLFAICHKCNDKSADCSVENLLKFAMRYQESGSNFWCGELLSFACSLEPDNRDALLNYGTFCFQNRKYDEALHLLQKASARFPNDSLIYNNLGAVYRKNGSLEEAADAFNHAVSCSPEFIGAIANLGDVLTELGKDEEAEQAYRTALDKDPCMHDVWKALANLLWRGGRFQEAHEAYERSLEIDPAQPDVYADLGLMNMELGLKENAIVAYSRALEMEACSPFLLCRLATVYAETGRADEAEILLLRAIECSPEDSEAYNIFSNLLRLQGRYKEAEEIALKSLTINKQDYLAHCNLGNVFFESQRFNEAEQEYLKALAIMPDSAVAYCNLGNVLMALGKFSEAENAYQDSITADPFFVDAYCNISALYKSLSRLAEAEEACRDALLLDPENSATLNNLSAVLLEMGRLDEAEHAARQAINIKPDFDEAHCTLGNVLTSLERPGEAVDSYRSSLNCNPEYAEAYSNIGNVLNDLGLYDEAKAAFKRALQLKPSLHACRIKLAMLSIPLLPSSVEEGKKIQQAFSAAIVKLENEAMEYGFSALGAAVGALQPFNLAYRPGDHKELLSRYGNFVTKARTAWFQEQYPTYNLSVSVERKRLRLVVVSGHIRRHSVWDVILHGLLSNIDRERFEVFIYHTVARTDAETEKAKQLVDAFYQGPADWLALICEHKPDVIFYPEICMDTETLKLASLRLAPLQVASWGHPVTTGLPTMDLFLSGDLMEHPDADTDYCEKLVRLPGTGACAVLMKYTPVKPGLSLSFPENKTIFLICQQMIKFDHSIDELLPQIAVKSGACCFVIVKDRKFSWASDLVEKRLRKAFTDAGLEHENYLLFIDWLPGDQFWGLMEASDIFLDLPSFSGYTTAWQAVHCGLPVVTLEGRYLRQRLASGLLQSVGINVTIASNTGEYIDIASNLANSSELRNKLGQLIRERADFSDEDATVVRAFEDILSSEYRSRLVETF